jgi:hypothetical protein
MRKVLSLVAASLALCLALAACQKIEEEPLDPTYVSEASLPVGPGEFSDAIPAEYGHLVDVTLHPNRPRVCFLWFESPEGVITLVRVDLQETKVMEGVLQIPRR